MNKMLKIGVASLAVAVSLSAFAADEEAVTPPYEDAVGWTPIAVSLASPVQLPWGIGDWDVFGLDVGLLYNDIAKMYGIGAAGLAMRTRDNLGGIQAALLGNWADRNVYGLRAAILANITQGQKCYGVEAAFVNYRAHDFRGLDVSLLGSCQQRCWGVMASGLATVSLEQSYGLNFALLGNYAKTAYGCQAAILGNYAAELHGAQIGLVNYAKDCAWGFQIGLINIIMSNQWKVLPIINAYF